MANRESLIDWLKQSLQSAADLEHPELHSGIGLVQLFYIKSLCDEKQLRENFILPFYKTTEAEAFRHFLQSLDRLPAQATRSQLLDLAARGFTVAVFEERVYLLDFQNHPNNKVMEATVESSVQGPKNALSEELGVNLNLLRLRYPQPTLMVENGTVGDVSKTPFAIVYDTAYYDPQVLQKIKDRLHAVHTDIIQAAGQLSLYMTKPKFSLFPTMMTTERPDRITLNLSQGKIVILIEGTPFALIAPAVFYDFMASMEDLYQTYWVSRFIITLRYLGLMINMTLAAFYVAITSYNPEVLRVQLTLSIAGSRASVPYPSYIEVMFMLIMMELLTEASIRLPKSIGSTATTVGGLILGQAATQAGLVSNIMIIIVAAVAISNFVIPINTMSFAFRIAKYLFLFMATFYGLVGMMVCTVFVISILANLDSFGKPFLRLYMEPPDNARKKTKGLPNGGADR